MKKRSHTSGKKSLPGAVVAPPSSVIGEPTTWTPLDGPIDTVIDIMVVAPASNARAGLTGWFAQFGTSDGRVHSRAAASPWEAIAWAIDSWIRSVRGEPWNLAQPPQLSEYPPIFPTSTLEGDSQ